jgi:hypothetical protein
LPPFRASGCTGSLASCSGNPERFHVLTIFTVPKPFQGHIGIIQRNALGSWARLRPACEVLVFGDEAGAGEAARQAGATHIPDVHRNEFGTPLLSSVFERAGRLARHDLLCYVNADILLLPDLVETARRVARAKPRFLMVGQRWDLDVTEPLVFERASWDQELRERVRGSGMLHPPTGSDYFVYPRGAIGALPAFAVGRPGWDNWMIYRARSLRLPVVDATSQAFVVHQNHAYGHVKQATDAAWEGPEADANRELMGGSDRLFTLIDATHRATPSGLARPLDWPHVKRRLRTAAIFSPRLGRIYAATRRGRSG